MRRNMLLFLICTLLLTFISMYTKAQVMRGGFGGLYAGPTYHINPSLQNKLSSDQVLGATFKANVIGSGYGGEGYTLRPRGFILGGSGYTSFYNSSTTNGSVRQRISTGFFIIGHTVANTKHLLAFPYLGVGAFGSDFTISNYGARTFLVGKDSVVYGKSSRYSSGGMAFDLGFAAKFMMVSLALKGGKRLKGMLGINTGLSLFPAFVKWQNVNTSVQIEGYNTPFIMALYMRVTLGIGVFKLD
jgi:hypothetical protein